jgi:hypothetical protein
MADVLGVISNAFFLIPCGQAVVLRHWTRAVLYFFMALVSAFYHTCDSWTGTCVLDATIHRKLDFFFAQLLIPVTALYIIKFKGVWCFLERVLIMFTALFLFVVEVVSNEPFIIQVIIAGASFLAIIVYWIGYALYIRKKSGGREWRIPKYDWGALVIAVACTALACVLFATQRMWHQGYPWVHSVWHALAGLGQYWVLMTRPKKGPVYPVLDRKIYRQIKNEHDE